MARSLNAIEQAAIDQLRRHAPFDQLSADDMAFLAAGLRLGYYSRGRVITSSASGVASVLFIVQSGVVRGELEGGRRGQDSVEYAEGECFPLAAVMGLRPTVYHHQATEDTFCYEADAATICELAHRSAPFLEFCSSRAGALLRQSYASLQALYASRSTAEVSVRARLGDLVRRTPLTCAPDCGVVEAVRAMHEARVGSIVVVGGAGQALGLFTERDLVRVIASGPLEKSARLDACMSAPPLCLPASAEAAEAAVLMAREGIRHVVVLDQQRVAGVVSERDLFALQRTSLQGIIDAIGVADDVAALSRSAAEIRRLASNMLAQGVGAEPLTQMIVTLNDRLTRRVLAIEAGRHGLSQAAFCWIALGSEGRLEQTLATDQDNGIIFATAAPHAETRERLLAFAAAVNRTLDACGFPLCKGNIMAGNPDCCLSVDEWKEKFSAWIRDPLPKALLSASIFFDFRALWGDESLARELRGWLAGQVHDNQRFLRAMAQGALESRPPLGLFTDFLTSDSEGAPDSIDLKAQGTRPFVDAARIFALASGSSETSTSARLRVSGERLRVPREEIEAVVESFQFILLYRLRQQQSDPLHANRVRPAALNELDRRILKEALRQARKLQSRLMLDYQL